MKTFDFRLTLKELVLLLVIALSPLSAYGGDLTGTIASILYWQPTPNIVFININGTTTGAPPCATQTYRMTIDISTPAGKAAHTSLLASKLMNPAASVALGGSNTCTLYGDTEDMKYIYL